MPREGRSPVGPHADADHDDAGVERDIGQDSVEHAGDADALEDHRCLRSGSADFVEESPAVPPADRQLREALDGVEGRVDRTLHGREVTERGLPAKGETSRGSTTTSAPMTVASARRPGERSLATTLSTPRALSRRDHGQADRAAAEDDGEVAASYLTSCHGVPGHRHRFGERGDVGVEAVGHGEGDGLLGDQPLGVAARGAAGQTEGVRSGRSSAPAGA